MDGYLSNLEIQCLLRFKVAECLSSPALNMPLPSFLPSWNEAASFRREESPHPPLSLRKRMWMVWEQRWACVLDTHHCCFTSFSGVAWEY